VRPTTPARTGSRVVLCHLNLRRLHLQPKAQVQVRNPTPGASWNTVVVIIDALVVHDRPTSCSSSESNRDNSSSFAHFLIAITVEKSTITSGLRYRSIPRRGNINSHMR
jgi:hypothetical protein